MQRYRVAIINIISYKPGNRLNLFDPPACFRIQVEYDICEDVINAETRARIDLMDQPVIPRIITLAQRKRKALTQ